jgi:hypothetical protein
MIFANTLHFGWTHSGAASPNLSPFPFREGSLSWQAVTWVLENSEATLGSRLVMICIGSHANREGLEACPSLNSIAKETLLSPREVVYCIQALEESGELHIDRGGGRGNPNRYSLPFVRGWIEKVQAIGGKYQKKETRKGLHSLNSVNSATTKKNSAIHDKKQCNALDVKPEESKTSTLQPLEPLKNRTVREVADSISIPRTVKSQPELLAERDRQLKAMREKGYLQ